MMNILAGKNQVAKRLFQIALYFILFILFALVFATSAKGTQAQDASTATTSLSETEFPSETPSSTSEFTTTDLSPTASSTNSEATTPSPSATPELTFTVSPTEALTPSATGTQTPTEAQSATPALDCSSVEYQDLCAAVVSDGLVRVIVELDVPVQPVGQLNQRQEDAQEARIDNAQEEVKEDLEGTEAEVIRELETIPFMSIEVDQAGLVELIGSTSVENIVIDEIRPPSLIESVPLIGAPTVWNYGYTGLGQTIAILDTGIQKTHPFITSAKVVSEACYSSTNPTYGSTTYCPNGSEEQIGSGAGVNCNSFFNDCAHGTHVAGIAAGKGTTFSGVAPDATLISIQVFSRFINPSICGHQYDCALAWDSDILAGLERVYQLQNSGAFTIAAVNLSLGGGYYSTYCDGTYPAFKIAIDNLRSVGVATIIAAGNNGYSGWISFPACISSAISVGATTKTDQLASYSNMVSFLSLLAPGSSIYSSLPANSYGTYSGTSMAAPHVAGAFALLKDMNQSLSVSQILGYLQSSGVTVGSKKRIQVDAALIAASPQAAAVSLVSPANNGFSVTNTPTFAWNSVVNGVTYQIQIDNVSNFVSPEQDVTLAAGVLDYTASPLLEAKYYWRVRGLNQYGLPGAWSTTYNTTVDLTPPAISAVTIPAQGSVLSGSTITFEWSDESAQAYWLDIGTSAGGNNLLNQGQGTSLSKTVTGLPVNGSLLYVRLWTEQENNWYFNDYTYTAAIATTTPTRTNTPTRTSTPTRTDTPPPSNTATPPAKAVMSGPPSGSTLSGSSVVLQWIDVGAAEYWLDIGTSAGGSNLLSQTQGINLTRIVSGLPVNGSTVYVRLWTRHGASWFYNDYLYIAATPTATSTRTQTLTPSDTPTRTETATPRPRSVMTNPAQGSTLPGSTVTFQWTDVGAQSYWLDIGTSAGGTNLLSQTQGTNTSKTINNIPVNGNTIYVRLWSQIGGMWFYNDYTYTAATPSATPTRTQTLTPTDTPTRTETPTRTNTATLAPRSVITNPAQGSILPGSTVTFQWTNVGAQSYWLDIGTTAGGTNLLSQTQGTNTSKTANNMPVNGNTIYVRLWSQIGGMWFYNDYTFTAAPPTATATRTSTPTPRPPAVMTSPAPGSTLSGSSILFQWTYVSAQEYWLYVGTTPGGYNKFNLSMGTSTSRTVTGLPINGSMLYVRLYTRHGSVWYYNDYTYTTGP